MTAPLARAVNGTVCKTVFRWFKSSSGVTNRQKTDNTMTLIHALATVLVAVALIVSNVSHVK